MYNMKANELRIGNYVKVSTPAITCDNFRVEEIRWVDCEYVIRHYPVAEHYYFCLEGFLRHAEPIPITPELLERCGFKNNVDEYYLDEKDITCIWRGDGLDIAEKGGRYYLWEECQDPWYSGCRIEVKSLHGLQNLYYALTGEELTITWN